MKRRNEQDGLLGKYRKQHTYMEKLVRQGVVLRDVAGPSPKEPVDDTRDSTLATRVETLTSENADLKKEISDLKVDIADITKELFNLKVETANLWKELADLEQRLSQLSIMEKVVIRKMLDRCRQRCVEILKEHSVPLLDDAWRFPADWHKVLEDTVCIRVLQDAGLSHGLSAMRFGTRSHQSEGSSAAHDITESPSMYATIVCKVTGEARKNLLNVFTFVFGRNAEDLTFHDDEF